MNNRFGIPEDAWKKILALLQKYPTIETVLVFGSRAMGTYREGSDIDLCLRGQRLDAHLIPKILQDYEELYLPWKLDLLVWHKIDNTQLKEHIIRVGLNATL